MLSLFLGSAEARISETQAGVDFFAQNDHVMKYFYNTTGWCGF
jgi:hypothetical protein